MTQGTDRYELVEPASVGVDPDRIDTLVERARREVDAGLLPSCQLALAREGRLVLFTTIGQATNENRYVVFSATKGIIAGAIWLLMSEGALDVRTKVAEIVPRFGTNGKDVVTVEQLLTHTSGFPQAPLRLTEAASREARLDRFERWRLNWEPGTRFEYHPLSAHWVLAEVIEVVGGMDYRELIHERLLEPLGLERFRLGEPPERQHDIAPLVAAGEHPTPEEIEEAIGIPGIDLATLVGEVTTEALLEFNDPSIRELGAPGAGGISTAADLALYYQSLLHNEAGLWDDELLVDATRRVRCDLPDPLRGVPAHRSLGLMVAGERETATMRGFGHGLSAETFGHNGAGGQIAWADPVSGLSFCYLTNGLDRNVLREARRSIGLSSRAAACLAA
ncbi:MAG: serine hydrolase domain-containing protein [Acidimicrobiales bacterium]